MNRLILITGIGLLGLSACGEAPPAEPVATYNIDKGRISVSGLSAGAYMASQYHVAHSSEVSGAGLIAGGPYRCAQGSMNQALGPCMNGGDLGVTALVEYARSQSDSGAIDPLENLNGDGVWVFRGAKEATIHHDVPAAASEFYKQAADTIEITVVTNIAAPHGMPTIVGDYACDQVAAPFLNNCDYDAAGEILKSVTTISNDRSEQPDGELLAIHQPGAANAEMLDDALLFVPAACAAGELCGIHIAFHGCQQSTEFVGDTFATGSGFNEWASGNNLLVLYPQVAKSSISPLNPLGCWDWWGYTGDDYATKTGAQVSVVEDLVDSLAGNPN